MIVGSSVLAITNVLAISTKYSLKISTTFVLSDRKVLPSRIVIQGVPRILFEKSGFTVFQDCLLSLTTFWSTVTLYDFCFVAVISYKSFFTFQKQSTFHFSSIH